MGHPRIRLARFGRRNLEFFRIWVANSTTQRQGKHLEQLGYYDPVPAIDGNKHVGLKIERIKYWLAVGAQPSDRVQWLLGRTGVLPMPPKAPKLIRPPKEEKKK